MDETDPMEVAALEATPAHAAGRGSVVSLWALMTLVTSSAAILTRYCGEVPAISIGFWRVFGAGVVLFPWWIVLARRRRPNVNWGAMLAGFFLGSHFATWAWALLHGPMANAALFIAMQPAITPVLGRIITGDRHTAMEYAGTALACLGMLWIVAGQAHFDPSHLQATIVAFVSMVCCALYFVLGRKFRRTQHVILFSVPVYFAAAITQALGALALDGRISGGVSTTSWLAILGLVLIPTVAGHTLAMYLLRHVKAQIIVLSVPVQFVLITLAGILLFGEWPKAWFYPGAAIVMTGVMGAILASGRRQQPTESRV